MVSLNKPGEHIAETLRVLARLPTWVAGTLEAKANLQLMNMPRHDMEDAHNDKTQAELPDTLCKLVLELKVKENLPLSELPAFSCACKPFRGR